MKYIIFLIFFLLSTCSGKMESSDFFTFEAPHGFEMIYNSGASKSVKEYYTSGSIVVNGSYFGVRDDGSYYPAGLWRVGQDELFPSTHTDPNITHVVTISRMDRSEINIFPNSELLTRRWGSEHDAFQAGPLVLRDNKPLSFSGSWHAEGEHERTLLGKTVSRKIYFFIFTEKVTLRAVGEKIGSKFENDPITLLNLDGGPSTAYYDGKKGFRENEKLPIIFHIKK